jgi:hypothetical protein
MIEDIKQRTSKATPGPWEYTWGDGIKKLAFTRKGDGELKRFPRNDQPIMVLANDGGCSDPDCCGGPIYTLQCSEDDGQFIAHAREDIPFLLEKIRELEEVNQKLKEANKWATFLAKWFDYNRIKGTSDEAWEAFLQNPDDPYA